MTEIEVKQQAEEKAEALAKQLGVKVHPIGFKDEHDGYITGFLKEPSMQVKLAILDKSMIGAFTASEELLEVILLRQHSHPRLSSKRPEDDRLYLGAVMAAYDLIKFNVDIFKKK